MPLGLAVALWVSSQGVPTARFPQTLSAEVFGHPALATTVQSAIAGAIQSQMKGLPGARFLFDPPAVGALSSASTLNEVVHVLATSADGTQASGPVHVAIRNTGDDFGREALLWFCNKPENLLSAGPLFDGTLEAGQPIRMLYHHQNKGVHPLYMRIELVNDSDKAATALVIPGDGRPNRDPIWSGYRAAEAFLPALLCDSGEVLNLPPHSAQPIVFRRLVMGDTASGLCSLKLKLGGPSELEVRAEAVDLFQTDEAWTEALMDPAPWHWVAPHEIFARVPASYELHPLVYVNPFVTGSIEAAVGGREATAQLGVEGIPQLGGGRSLNGNYGVLHTFDVTLTNPTEFAGHIEFQLEAATGYTSGAFVTPIGLVMLHPLQAKERATFWTVRLAAHETTRFQLYAMPVSGGFYPATIRVHTAP